MEEHDTVPVDLLTETVSRIFTATGLSAHASRVVAESIASLQIRPPTYPRVLRSLSVPGRLLGDRGRIAWLRRLVLSGGGAAM